MQRSIRHRVLAVLAAVAVVALAALPAFAQLTEVSPQNEAINAAIEKAKSTLPVFFARLANPQPGDSGFLVKIRYDKKSTSGGEHIWAKDVVKSGNTVSATIDNEPKDIADMVRGQRVTVPITQLTDWLYERRGKYHGAYTVRALVPFMTKEQAADMRKRLAPE